MLLTLHTKALMAHDLRHNIRALRESQILHRLLSEFDAKLEVMHPESSSHTLMCTFSITVADQKAGELRKQIDEAGIVEGVYIKPKDAAPAPPPLPNQKGKQKKPDVTEEPFQSVDVIA